MTISITTISIMKLSTFSLSITAISTMKLGTMALSITTFSTMPLWVRWCNVDGQCVVCRYVVCHLRHILLGKVFTSHAF